MRNAQGFPDPGVKGDPSILGAIHRRQAINPGGASVVHLANGTVVTPRKRRQAPGGLVEPGPFEPVLSGNKQDGYKVTVTPGEIRGFESVNPISSIVDIDTPLPAVDGDVVYLELSGTLYIYYARVVVGSVGEEGDGWEGYPARGKFIEAAPYDMDNSYLELARVQKSDPEDEESPLELVGIWKSGNIVTQQAFVYGKLGAFAFPGN